MSKKLPPIFDFLGGKPKELIDLSQDIPKLMEYIQEFDNGTAETIKSGETTYEFGYYYDQLHYFTILHPNFDTSLIPNKDLQRVLSGFYSNNILRDKEEIRNYKKRFGY